MFGSIGKMFVKKASPDVAQADAVLLSAMSFQQQLMGFNVSGQYGEAVLGSKTANGFWRQ